MKEDILKTFKEITPNFRNISYIEFINARLTAAKREKYINNFMAIEDDRYTIISDVYIYSYYVRKKYS